MISASDAASKQEEQHTTQQQHNTITQRGYKTYEYYILILLVSCATIRVCWCVLVVVGCLVGSCRFLCHTVWLKIRLFGLIPAECKTLSLSHRLKSFDSIGSTRTETEEVVTRVIRILFRSAQSNQLKSTPTSNYSHCTEYNALTKTITTAITNTSQSQRCSCVSHSIFDERFSILSPNSISHSIAIDHRGTNPS